MNSRNLFMLSVLQMTLLETNIVSAFSFAPYIQLPIRNKMFAPSQSFTMLAQIPVARLRISWQYPDAMGGFGAVYFGQTSDGDQVVVKLSYNDTFSERLLENEMRFNDKLTDLIPEHHGRRWATFLGTCPLRRPAADFPTSLSKQRALVFKREEGVTIETYLSKPTKELEQALAISKSWLGQEGKLRVVLFRKVLGELLCAIAQLHSAGLIHRDIKPANILVVPSDRHCPVKLIDLGSACDLGSAFQTGITEETLDPLYAPPEQRMNAKHPESFDVFCAATTAMRVLFPSMSKVDGDKLVNDNFKDWLQVEMLEVDYDLTKWCQQQVQNKGRLASEASDLLQHRNADVLNLLQAMMDKDPARRPSPKALLRQMGPVWSARVQSIEMLAPNTHAHSFNKLLGRVRHALCLMAPELLGLLGLGVWKAVQQMMAGLTVKLPQLVSLASRRVGQGTTPLQVPAQQPCPRTRFFGAGRPSG